MNDIQDTTTEIISITISNNLTKITSGTSCSSEAIEKSYQKPYIFFKKSLVSKKHPVSKKVQTGIVFDEESNQAKFVAYIQPSNMQEDIFLESELADYIKYVSNTFNSTLLINKINSEKSPEKQVKFITDDDLDHPDHIIYDEDAGVVTASSQIINGALVLNDMCQDKNIEGVLKIADNSTKLQHLEKIKSGKKITQPGPVTIRCIVNNVNRFDNNFSVKNIEKDKIYKSKYPTLEIYNQLYTFQGTQQIIEIKGCIKMKGRLILEESNQFEFVEILSN